MRDYEYVPVETRQLTKLTCDVCGLDLLADDMERQEAFHLNQEGGYTSVFGDGAEIHIDLCQHCFKKLLGQFATVI